MRSEGLEYDSVFHKVVGFVEAAKVFSGLFFTSVIFPSLLRDNNQVCERTLSPVGDSRCQGCTTIPDAELKEFRPNHHAAGPDTHLYYEPLRGLNKMMSYFLTNPFENRPFYAACLSTVKQLYAV